MVLPDLIHICAIFVLAIHYSDSCTETYAYSGDENVKLIFDYSGNTIGESDASKISCYKGNTYIGFCQWKFSQIHCVLNSPHGNYNLSYNVDYGAVNITILLFDDSTAGNYTCSKEKGKSSSICIQTLVNLTALMLLPQANVTYAVHEEQSLFTCTTSPSRPSARIQWFVAGRNITDNANYTYSSDVASSILRYMPQSNTSEDLTCTAYYVYKSTNVTIQRGTHMKIQFPVTKPIISIKDTNVSKTVTIREGRLAEFKCSASSYPLPSYRWVYPGGTSEMETVTIKFNRTANGGNMSCIATNHYYSLDGTSRIKSTTFDTVINLNITYPPLFVRIKSIENNVIILDDNIIRLVKGDSLRLMGESVANPPATTLWQGQQGQSNVLIANNIQEDIEWTCVTFNIIDGLRENKNRTIHAVVLYGPVSMNLKFNILPDLSQTGTVINNDYITVIEGSAVQLTCFGSSSPTSHYSWDNGLEGNILIILNISRATNTSYMCMAENVMDTSFNGFVTERNNISLHLHVLYGPRDMSVLFNNTLVISRVLRVLEGWSFGLSCIANSQPASDISWKGITNQGGGNYIFINNVSTGINKNVTCTGTNTMVDSLGHSISKSENLMIELDVLYPPVVQPIENQYVVINMSLNVVCKLSTFGNPSNTHFSWKKLDSNRTFLNANETFQIDRAQLSDEGDYQCQATNTMDAIGNKPVQGSSKSQFYLDIQYGARVKQFYTNTSNSRTIIISQNQTIELICEVDGDPYPSANILNATGEQPLELSGSIGASKNVTSHLHRARCEYDAGKYKCVTSNVHTSTLQEENLSILIQCSPIASPFAPPVTTLHRAPNDTAVLTFTIKAYPEPSVTNFTWFKGVSDGWDILSNDYHYTISVSEDGLQTELTINNVHKDDFGTYRVNVSNTIGSTYEVFTLKAKAKPENPQEVNVVRRGITEIELEWVPGFNGGEQQTFIINYTDTNLQIWHAVRAPANSTTHTLRGLKPDTTYEVKMRAENIIGNSSWTDYIDISTLAEIEQKGFVSKAVGGIVGGLSVIFIIIAVIIVWRRRKTDRKDPFSHQILPKRSGTKKPENTTYENIGMLTRNSNKYNMTSSFTENLKQPTKHVQAAKKLAQNNPKSLNGTFEHTDFTKNTDPHRKALVGDIQRSGKADVDEFVQPHGQNSFALEQDAIYDNLVKKQTQFRSKDIAIHTLRECVVKAKDDSTEVFTEFIALNVASESISYSTDSALKSANTSKNRYKNMYPYDKNRVKLPVVGNDIDSDFINASFIDGYLSPKKYIAAQGPLASTRADFWSMIWEQNVGVVAMVTNLVEESKRKCFQYWPISSENDCQYSDYTIRLLSEETYANFVVRTLHCSKSGSIKVQTVNHLHFTAWPDKDVPDTALSLMQFWRKVRNVEKPDGAPWIVHCSAGVGRTGTFIALDYLYDQGITEKQINVFDAVLLLRQQRINMVQTKNQYLYLHEVLCEALCTVGEVFENTAFIDTPRTSDSLNQEYQHICKSHIPDREEGGTDGEYTLVLDGEKPDNLNKNADLCVVPDDRYRPVLNVTLNTLGHNDYVNAVYISTFGEKDRLILTQSALVSSAIDFVRLLHDHVIRTVVTFADEVEPYMPGSSESCLIGPFTATTKSDTQKQVYKESVVQFKYIAEYEGFEVRIIRFTKWSNSLDVCNIKDLMSLLISVQESACRRPVVLQCRDGYSQSGLFAVLWCLVERCQRDGEVAVAETVKMIRRRRKQVITNEAQYRFCHQFMKEYIEGSLVYANT